MQDKDWTCKKCTLVNVPAMLACAACGGSKLRSISSIEETTLKKGEFWSCVKCTLKNSLSDNICGACKTPRNMTNPGNNLVNILLFLRLAFLLYSENLHSFFGS